MSKYFCSGLTILTKTFSLRMSSLARRKYMVVNESPICGMEYYSFETPAHSWQLISSHCEQLNPNNKKKPLLT